LLPVRCFRQQGCFEITFQSDKPMQSYLLFTAAFLVSIVTPGPDVVVVASKASSAGSAGRCLALIFAALAAQLAGLFRSSGAQRRVNRASGAAMVGAAVLVAAR
jgi:threonine/homoserine/homoserine lactone efflux protein